MRYRGDKETTRLKKIKDFQKYTKLHHVGYLDDAFITLNVSLQGKSEHNKYENKQMLNLKIQML